MLPKLHTGMYQRKNTVGFFFNRTELWCDVNFNKSIQKKMKMGTAKNVHAKRERFHSHSQHSKYQEVKYLHYRECPSYNFFI